MKELLGPLEIRRRLVREEKGFREYWTDRISEWLHKSAAPSLEAKSAALMKGKTQWLHHTKVVS
jgi:hypothetical protein